MLYNVKREQCNLKSYRFFNGSSENFIEKLPVGDSATKVVDFFYIIGQQKFYHVFQPNFFYVSIIFQELANTG